MIPSQRPSLLALLVGLAFSGALSARDEADEKKAIAAELKLLAGEWRIVAAEIEGKPAEVKTVAKFAAGTGSLNDPGFPPLPFTFTIDPSKAPKWLDMTTPATKKVFLGIYELKGDALVAVFRSEKDGRPTLFNTEKGVAGVRDTYERIKAK